MNIIVEMLCNSNQVNCFYLFFAMLMRPSWWAQGRRGGGAAAAEGELEKVEVPV